MTKLFFAIGILGNILCAARTVPVIWAINPLDGFMVEEDA